MFDNSHDISKEDLVYGFFGRKGGVSTGIYESLNCGIGSDDDADAVQENRERACKALNLKPENLLGLIQVHGDDCVIAEKGLTNDERPQADAMVTDVPGLVLSILTADCAPVFFFGEKKDGAPVIGAAHAGWKGVAKGVLDKTIQAMQKVGVNTSSVHAIVGPCIGLQSYEVAEGFREPFLSRHTGSAYYFHDFGRKGYLHFDMPGYVKRRLELAGVHHIGVVEKDTYANEDKYFSYRRSVHKKEKDYGRQISMISIPQ